MYAIETHNLSRSFGNRIAVDNLTLSIPKGIVFGFLGPNGAGKTTTVRMLTALIAPTQGTASVAGYVVGNDDQAIRQSVGILTETPGLYDRLTALFVGQLAGFQVLSLLITLIVALLLVALAFVAMWMATLFFQRETILTRWK